MANFDELFVYKLYTSLTGDFEHLNLWLYEEVECEFRDKETGSWPGRVSNGGANVENREILSGINAVK